MPNFIDRRLNPKDKSLGNRQRFLKRAREELKRTIKERVKSGKIADVDAEQNVSMPARGVNEPAFQPDSNSGERRHVLPGNREFAAGDRIPKRGSGGGAGNAGAGTGQSEDEFQFVLSREEVLDLFFEDLELPDMVKLNLKEWLPSSDGAPVSAQAARRRTSMSAAPCATATDAASHCGGRRAGKSALADEIAGLETEPRGRIKHRQRLEELRQKLDRLERRRRRIPYVDPVDIRFNRFEPQPLPNASAVMFCLMDVSASMGEREKDLAKRFFVLLHLFLKRRYERIDIVFIRHTDEAGEVDENTFFYSKQSGGTVVSTALEEMLRVIRERYPAHEWNIYAAQASDGENISGDSERCASLLHDELMGLCQYYAYVEIIDERETEIFGTTDNGTSLWRAYRTVDGEWPNFQMTRIAKPADIYPVFRKLFGKQPEMQLRK